MGHQVMSISSFQILSIKFELYHHFYIITLLSRERFQGRKRECGQNMDCIQTGGLTLSGKRKL